jgi:amino acid transporter
MASSPSPMASPPPLPLASSPPSPSLPPPFSSPPPSPNITTSVSGRMLQQFEEVEPPQDEMALGRELQEAIVLYNTPAMVFAFWLSVATILVATIFVFRPTLFAGKIAMVGTLIKLVMLVSWVVEAFWTTFPGSSPFHVTGNGYFGSWLAVAFAAQMFYAVAPAMPEGRTSEVLSSKSVDAEVSKAAVEEDAMAL